MSVALERPTKSLIPWIFVGGFAIVIAVNTVMICLAVGSFSGLYTSKPRERGLAYNEVIAEQARRDALGWRLDTAWRPESGRLEVVLLDAEGKPLAPSALKAELVRPAEKRPPLPVTLVPTDIGRFAADLVLPERGNWDLDIVVERGNDRFAVTRRMFLK
jgi:nitrogen fixation protein FixH